ncbi:hypothetical protein Hypma_013938 [Hypsizygus marmoreus]|uniref:Uncharacterized protein n=1 Tax=Hypsizygus marmoreus TaxID=39966 RepID=A0A369K8D5_HYPMA|nr:hypothetical protein Hypma_013938 [Hypsizygus marmoreus]
MPAINRWIAGILLFTFTLRHVPGKDHGPADGLSRRPAAPEDNPRMTIHDWIDTAHINWERSGHHPYTPPPTEEYCVPPDGEINPPSRLRNDDRAHHQYTILFPAPTKPSHKTLQLIGSESSSTTPPVPRHFRAVLKRFITMPALIFPLQFIR